MKRSEIEIGAVLYYDRSTNWEDKPGYGNKAVVVDTRRYRRTDFRDGPNREPWVQDDNGDLVLVNFHHHHSPTPTREAVRPAHLRGPYEPTRARLQEAEARRQANYRRQREARQQRQDRQIAAVQAAQAAGIEVLTTAVGKPAEEYVAVPVAELERLTALLAEQHNTTGGAR